MLKYLPFIFLLDAEARESEIGADWVRSHEVNLSICDNSEDKNDEYLLVITK